MGKRFLLCLYIYLFSAVLWGVTGENISLKPRAEVNTVFVRLYDIVREPENITGIDTRGIFLGKSPSGSRKLVMSRKFIRRRIYQAGVSPERVQLSGPEKITITRLQCPAESSAAARSGSPASAPADSRAEEKASADVPVHQLVACVDRYFSEKYQGTENRVTVKMISCRTPIRVSEDAAYTVRVLKQPRVSSNGKLHISIGVFVNGVLVDSGSCRFYVKIMHKVYAVSRPLKKDAVLSNSDLEETWVECRPGKRKYIFRTEHAVGKKLTKDVARGAVLRIRDIEKVPAVSRGEIVDAIYKAKNLVIKARVKVMEEGSAGDVVSGINIHSGRKITGTITREGQIRL